jgi:anti-sigma factor RsiW
MPDCSRIDSLVTPFVDGELPQGEQQTMTEHLSRCPSCRAKVAVERAVRAQLHSCRTDLTPLAASPELKARCAGLLNQRSGLVVQFPQATTSAPVPALSTWRRRYASFALAATLLLAVGGAFLYQATRSSSRVLAAELTVDHEKCFRLNHLLGTQQSSETVEAALASSFGWKVELPDTSGHVDVRLVGSRPCLYGEGRIAHIMYMHNGQPVSLFMLPREARQDQLVQVFGHQCRIWSEGDRTFVLVARESAPEMEQMVALVRTTIR